MPKIIVAFVLSFFPLLVVADDLLVEKDFQKLHFVYSNTKKSELYYYGMWLENADKCPVFLSDKGIKLVVTDKEKNFYQISYESGYLCVYSSSKLLADKWRPYQITPDIEFLLANSSRSPGSSPPSPLPPERRKPEKLSFKCEFKNSKIEGVNMCELPLNW